MLDVDVGIKEDIPTEILPFKRMYPIMIIFSINTTFQIHRLLQVHMFPHKIMGGISI